MNELVCADKLRVNMGKNRRTYGIKREKRHVRVVYTGGKRTHNIYHPQTTLRMVVSQAFVCPQGEGR